MTASHTWTVNTTLSGVIINEVLAANSTTVTNAGTTPDLIELYNPGVNTIDLSSMGLTDSATLPYKYAFPAGTTLDNKAISITGSGKFVGVVITPDPPYLRAPHCGTTQLDAEIQLCPNPADSV